jgi:amidohydrolase
MSDASGMTETMHKALLAEANELLPWAVALRRRIHRRPELALDLPATQEAVLESLHGLPLDLQTGSGLSSVVATLEGRRPGRTILLRGDMDALPMPEDTGLAFASEVDGAMHACGHDAHVAMLAAAAHALAARRDSLAGRVVFMFQPGEEGHHGARVMLEEGLLDGPTPPDAAFALHVTPTMPASSLGTRGGTLLASADEVRITVRGRGGHASAPHDALDPIPVACEIVTALQTAVTRRINVFDPAVVTIASVHAGTTSNVIPESAVLFGTMRTVSDKTRDHIAEVVRQVATGVAAAHGAEAAVEITRGFPVTVNDSEFSRFVLGVAERLDAGRVMEMPAPIMGAEDFSYVLQRLPGAMAFLGVRPDVEGPIAPNHSNRMLIDEPSMATGIATHCAVALEYLAS